MTVLQPYGYDLIVVVVVAFSILASTLAALLLQPLTLRLLMRVQGAPLGLEVPPQGLL